MNIAIFEAKPKEAEYFKKSIHGHKIRFFPKPLDEKNVLKIKNAEAVIIFIYSNINEKILNKLQSLKLIATKSTGFDHIDLEACKKRKIIVSNVPSYGDNTVAEHTFALILSLSRNIHKSYVRTQKNDFSIDGLTGFDLKGKTLGIVGGGRIGMHVAKIAKGFSMEVLVYDVIKQPFLAEVIGFRYTPLDELLMNSDVITLHVPLNKFPHHLINKHNIKKVKKGAL